jgi:hypothetical protein
MAVTDDADGRVSLQLCLQGVYRVVSEGASFTHAGSPSHPPPKGLICDYLVPAQPVADYCVINTGGVGEVWVLHGRDRTIQYKKALAGTLRINRHESCYVYTSTVLLPTATYLHFVVGSLRRLLGRLRPQSQNPGAQPVLV